MPSRNYEVKVRIWTDRTVYVQAGDFGEAEEKALQEVTALVGGYEPEVLYVVPVEEGFGDDDWPIDRADD